MTAATAAESTAANPFGSKDVAQRAANAVAETDQQRAIAETQAAMIIAKRFPRDQKAAMDRILMAAARPTLAEQSLYSYSRGGSEITGPSIRLAEALAQNWGNIQFGIRELEQRNGESSVEAFAWDIETNTRQVKVFQVPHIRHTRSGTKRLEDPRDIYEMVANQGARRLRACILGVIPGDVIEGAVKQCELTMKTNLEITPEFIAQMLDRFAEFGVVKEQIEIRIQRRIDAMTPALAVQLKKIYTSMKDGMSKPDDWFEPTGGTDAGETGKPATGANALKEAARKKAAGEAAGETGKPGKKAEPRNLLADVLKLCERSEAAADTEAAALMLDEARDLARALAGEDKTNADAAIKKANDRLQPK